MVLKLTYFLQYPDTFGKVKCLRFFGVIIGAKSLLRKTEDQTRGEE